MEPEKKNEILNKEINDNSKLIEEIVYDIVKHYTEPLDAIMKLCRDIFNSGMPATDDELSDLVLQLPSTLYFVGEGQECVGIREDIAEMTKKQKYNIAREKAVGTIADKNSTAEGAVYNEAINQIIYQRSYKMIRSKIEMGYEMINSIKRVIDKRNKERELSGGIMR